MKRTRKSEAAETKVRILRLGNESWGEERRLQKSLQSQGGMQWGRLFCVWAEREFSTEVNRATCPWHLMALLFQSRSRMERRPQLTIPAQVNPPRISFALVTLVLQSHPPTAPN